MPTMPGKRQPRHRLHDSIGFQLTLAARTYERRLEEGLRAAGLTRAEWCVLVSVIEEGLSRPSHIAAHLGIDRAALSRTLGRLERRGLVSRSSTGDDGRNRAVRATAAGKEALEQALPAARAALAHFEAKLAPGERAELAALLSALREGEPRRLPRL